MQEFERIFFQLREHPDKDLIGSLTTFSIRNGALANSIVAMICSRIVDFNLPATFKLPIFYLMDSVMKETARNGIPGFVSHFEYTLGLIHSQVFQVVSFFIKLFMMNFMLKL